MFDKKAIVILLSVFYVLAFAPIVDHQISEVDHSKIKPLDSGIPTVEAATKKYKYVASKKSKVYHRLNCRYVKKIKKYNRIYFKTKKKAKKNRRPCKVCRP